MGEGLQSTELPRIVYIGNKNSIVSESRWGTPSVAQEKEDYTFPFTSFFIGIVVPNSLTGLLTIRQLSGYFLVCRGTSDKLDFTKSAQEILFKQNKYS